MSAQCDSCGEPAAHHSRFTPLCDAHFRELIGGIVDDSVEAIKAEQERGRELDALHDEVMRDDLRRLLSELS